LAVIVVAHLRLVVSKTQPSSRTLTTTFGQTQSALAIPVVSTAYEG
jgi:hypothetical protein